MVESLNLLDVLGTLPKGGNSCRATKTINLICGDCMEKMVVAE